MMNAYWKKRKEKGIEKLTEVYHLRKVYELSKGKASRNCSYFLLKYRNIEDFSYDEK